jgi:hypothetical protein
MLGFICPKFSFLLKVVFSSVKSFLLRSRLYTSSPPATLLVCFLFLSFFLSFFLLTSSLAVCLAVVFHLAMSSCPHAASPCLCPSSTDAPCHQASVTACTMSLCPSWVYTPHYHAPCTGLPLSVLSFFLFSADFLFCSSVAALSPPLLATRRAAVLPLWAYHDPATDHDDNDTTWHNDRHNNRDSTRRDDHDHNTTCGVTTATMTTCMGIVAARLMGLERTFEPNIT